MKSASRNLLLIVGILIALTSLAMAYVNRTGPVDPGGFSGDTNPFSPSDGPVTISGRLARDKVFSGGNGRFTLSLQLQASDLMVRKDEIERHADLVIVLDRSGSMNGKKLDDAQDAVLSLMAQLSEKDRFALVSYSNSVQAHSSLSPMTVENRERFSRIVRHLSAGGGTNLGAGLKKGIDLLLGRSIQANSGKVILISDGIANQGITDPAALGHMAAMATETAFSISTIGVGADFNELLMTSIANHGSGNYHYLEDPAALALIFQKEFQNARNVTAGSVKISIPLSDGVTLVDASGYPFRIRDGVAEFFPGDLLAGQTKKLFLTFRIPTVSERAYAISGVSVDYRHQNKRYQALLSKTFHIACVNNRTEALSAIHRDEWEKKVILDDFNRLKEEVAREIKKGDQRKAMERIQAYEAEKREINQAVQAAGVESNLKNEVGKLREVVEETFLGTRGEVLLKQKRNAKSLQYEGYTGRRLNP